MSTPTTPPVSPRTPATPIQGTPKKPGNNTWGSWSVDIFDPTSKEIENYLYQISHSKAYWHSTWLALLPAPVTALYDAAASLAQGAGKTVIWFVDFNQSKEELIFDIAGTALLNLLRSGRLMLALPILAVVGRLFPQTFFDGLNYTPQTTEGEKNKLIGEQSAKLADAQNNLAAVSKSITETKKELATAQKDLIDVQTNLATEKELLAQTTGTVGKMAGSLAESQRLQTLVTTLTEQASALRGTDEALTKQHEEFSRQLPTLVKQHDYLSTSLEEQGTTLRETLDRLTVHEGLLRGQIEARKLEIKGSDKTLQLKGQELAALQSKIAKLQKDTEEYETKIVAPLHGEVRALDGNKTAITQQIADAKLELGGVRDDITKDKDTLFQQEKTLKILSDQHQVLKGKQEKLVRQQVDLYTNVIPGLEEEERTLKQILTQLNAQEAGLKGQIEAKKKEIKDSDEILQLKGQELAALQGKIAELQRQERSLTSAAATSEKQQKELSQALEKLGQGQEQELLAPAVTALRNQNEKLKAENFQLVDKMSADRAAHDQQLVQFAKTAEQVAKACQEKTELAEKNLREFEARVKTAKAEQRKELAEEYKARRAEFTAALKQAMEEEQAKLKSLQKEVEALRLERDKMVSAPAAAKASDQADGKK